MKTKSVVNTINSARIMARRTALVHMLAEEELAAVAGGYFTAYNTSSGSSSGGDDCGCDEYEDPPETATA